MFGSDDFVLLTYIIPFSITHTTIPSIIIFAYTSIFITIYKFFSIIIRSTVIRICICFSFNIVITISCIRRVSFFLSSKKRSKYTLPPISNELGLFINILLIDHFFNTSNIKSSKNSKTSFAISNSNFCKRDEGVIGFGSIASISFDLINTSFSLHHFLSKSL